MPVLIAAVVLLAVIVVLNLAVTVAVLGRLRTRTWGHTGPRPDGPGGLARGAALPAFAAPAVDGTIVGPDTFAGRRTLVGLFATSCPGCADAAPAFAAWAARLADADVATVAVLATGPGEDGGELVGILTKVGTLVVERRPGAVMDAFGAQITPSYFLVDATGRIERKGLTWEECLPAVPVGHG
jgi:thiol-disulfide isomerase/thioredoxin